MRANQRNIYQKISYFYDTNPSYSKERAGKEKIGEKKQEVLFSFEKTELLMEE